MPKALNNIVILNDIYKDSSQYQNIDRIKQYLYIQIRVCRFLLIYSNLVKIIMRYIPNIDDLANVSRTMKQIFIINDMKNTHIKLCQSISVIMSF